MTYRQYYLKESIRLFKALVRYIFKGVILGVKP